MTQYEADVCIIGSGIVGTAVADALIKRSPGSRVIMIEAGKSFQFEDRWAYRQRSIDYGEDPWPGDKVDDQYWQTMAVGGQALHWSAVTGRFCSEDLRQKSMFGLAQDWPMTWEDLEQWYCRAEAFIGVSGEASPFIEDRRSAPYPMPPLPLSYNLKVLKERLHASELQFWSAPEAKNSVPYGGRAKCLRCDTCHVCPTGAKYTPDFTLGNLVRENKLVLHKNTLINKLVLDSRSDKIVSAHGRDYLKPDEEVVYRASTFVLANGFINTPHLLLLSACEKYPAGLANRSGQVGASTTAHTPAFSLIELPQKLYPGMNIRHGLYSNQFFRVAKDNPHTRHDLYLWEYPREDGVWVQGEDAGPVDVGHVPTLKGPSGNIRLGEELFSEWKKRKPVVVVRAFRDFHWDNAIATVLDRNQKNRFGDPRPAFVPPGLSGSARKALPKMAEHVEGVFQKIAGALDGKILKNWAPQPNSHSHPSGSCRMGDDPASSVCDSFGRTHDHPNLWIVGSPTLPTGGATNATLTFVALALRSAHQLANELKG